MGKKYLVIEVQTGKYFKLGLNKNLLMLIIVITYSWLLTFGIRVGITLVGLFYWRYSFRILISILVRFTQLDWDREHMEIYSTYTVPALLLY